MAKVCIRWLALVLLINSMHGTAHSTCKAGSSNEAVGGPALLQTRAGKVKALAAVRESEGEPPTCVAEKVMRAMLNSSNIGSKVIRGVFHDASDMDNLLVRSADSSLWERVDGMVDGSYGGIDGCLHSPLSGADGPGTGDPTPSHNRNIPSNGFQWARDLCWRVCRAEWPGGLKGTRLCASHEDCEVEATVLGSLLAIEQAGGLPMQMTWGRTRGTCDGYVAGADAEYALDQAPALHGMDAPELFRSTFERMGFTPTDQVALMGAHSFGRLSECADGLNGVEHGLFCWNTSLNGMLSTDNLTDAFGGNQAFGDGGVFDTTPTIFDNDYFKLFELETFGQKDTCCGKVKNGFCHRGGSQTPVRITERNATDQSAISWESVADGVCSIDWCRSDRKGRSHMKSTKAWTLVEAGFMKAKHGLTKRMIRLAADWSLLAFDDTHAEVVRFAADQPTFFDAFATAWGKLIARTNLPVQPCSGSATDAEVQSALEAMGCQDNGPVCDHKQNKCHKAKIQGMCRRTCGLCPDQQA